MPMSKTRPVHFDATGFGFVVANGERHDHDVVVLESGKVKKRKKKLSKAASGSAHQVAAEEIAASLHPDAGLTLVVGTGQYGVLELTDEARRYLDAHGVHVDLAPTPEAIRRFNALDGRKGALIHVTC